MIKLKFNELKYERPDVLKIKKQGEIMLKQLKKATTYEDAKK